MLKKLKSNFSQVNNDDKRMTKKKALIFLIVPFCIIIFGIAWLLTNGI